MKTIKICKYCNSKNIDHLTTSSGFGGGDVYLSNNFRKLLLCLDCGKITLEDQLKEKRDEG